MPLPWKGKASAPGRGKKHIPVPSTFKLLYIAALLGTASLKIFFPLQDGGFFPEWFGPAAAAAEIISAFMLMRRFSKWVALFLLAFFLAAGIFSWIQPEAPCGCLGSFHGGKGFHDILLSLMGLGATFLFLREGSSGGKKARTTA